MRPHVHDTPVRFRVNEQLLATAKLKAKRQGMSLSELLRAALRETIRSEDMTASAIEANAALGPSAAEIVARAARGDAASQHWLLEDRLAALSRYETNSVAA